MEIVYALLLGVAIGGVLALIALAILLSVIKRSDAKAAAALAAGENADVVNRKTIYSVLRFYIGKYFLDVLLLLAMFLLRGWLPFRWEFVLLSTGVMMTIFFQILLACTGVNKHLNGKSKLQK